MNKEHPDFSELQLVRDAILKRFDDEANINETFPLVVANAVDYVIDPIRTGRTRIVELDNVEKTTIGLKVEHFVRDWLGVPPGLRDLNIDGHDVDVKNTVGDNWMIPQETYTEERGSEVEPGGTCLLIKIDENANRCSLGLLRVRESYLTKPNRDRKRGVSSSGKTNILWLVSQAPYQEGHWQGFDMQRFRELRQMRGGNNRVVAFFSENKGDVVHRSILMALLYDQKDPMKRLRWNGGAKLELWEKGIVLLSGAYFSKLAQAFDIFDLRA